MLPVMIAFIDEDRRYRFEQADGGLVRAAARRAARPDDPRAAGRRSLGDARTARRGRLRRRAQVLRRRLQASDPRQFGGSGELHPVDGFVGTGARAHHPRPGRDRAARRGTGAARKRGALPPDRRPGADLDVGHAARPDARLRQRRLYAIRRRDPRGGVHARLARAYPSRRP